MKTLIATLTLSALFLTGCATPETMGSHWRQQNDGVVRSPMNWANSKAARPAPNKA